MIRYNKPDLSDVEFRMYRPTSSASKETALMPAVEPSRTAGGDSTSIGYSVKNSEAIYSQTISFSRLMKLVQMAKKKIPQFYLRFMTTKPADISSQPQASLKRPLRATSKKVAARALLCGDGIITWMMKFFYVLLLIYVDYLAEDSSMDFIRPTDDATGVLASLDVGKLSAGDDDDAYDDAHEEDDAYDDAYDDEREDDDDDCDDDDDDEIDDDEDGDAEKIKE